MGTHPIFESDFDCLTVQKMSEPMFTNISADADNMTEIESLCMACHENGKEQNGKTTILMTKIPFFKEMIVMSFRCDDCGYRNNEVQSGGRVETNGVKVIAIVDGARDLNRQVVKSEHCTVKIPELDFEIPPQTQKGSLTTVEGLIQKAADGLRHTAELNAETNPEWAEAVQAFCAEKLEPIVKRKFQSAHFGRSLGLLDHRKSAPALSGSKIGDSVLWPHGGARQTARILQRGRSGGDARRIGGQLRARQKP